MLGLMLAAQVVATPWQLCDVPPEAYTAAAEIQATGDYHDNRQIIKLMMCYCGPEGSRGLILVEGQDGKMFGLPRCNRLGWNGIRYWPPR